jgi:hypothetical protein
MFNLARHLHWSYKEMLAMPVEELELFNKMLEEAIDKETKK